LNFFPNGSNAFAFSSSVKAGFSSSFTFAFDHFVAFSFVAFEWVRQQKKKYSG
jgi:hypothetical protein